MNGKTNQRMKLRKRIAQFSSKQPASNKILSKLLHLEDYRLAKSLFVYLSSSREVDTAELITKALSCGKRIFVPITRDIMYLSEIYLDTEFVQGRFGIREPKHANLVNIQPDAVIVPLVGFDKNKNRLGQGRGYYDRYLNGYEGKKIGLAFSIQQVEKVITEACDIKLDTIITEEKIF